MRIGTLVAKVIFPDHALERSAAHKAHHGIGRFLIAPGDLMDGQDRRMLEAGRDAAFAFKQRSNSRSSVQSRSRQFDGDRSPQVPIIGSPDPAQTAHAQNTRENVPAAPQIPGENAISYVIAPGKSIHVVFNCWDVAGSGEVMASDELGLDEIDRQRFERTELLKVAPARGYNPPKKVRTFVPSFPVDAQWRGRPPDPVGLPPGTAGPNRELSPRLVMLPPGRQHETPRDNPARGRPADQRCPTAGFLFDRFVL